MASPYLYMERNMKLQILVPQYNETNEVIKPLLDSIAIQQNVDFKEIGVIICNDGSDTFLSWDFLDSYPYKIEYHKEPHRGISGARNACLDYATADYVMFCDADDMFSNACGLFIIFMDMENGFDSLVSAFVEETRDKKTGDIIYLEHEYDTTYVHGKVHRRQFLLDNGLRFKEELTVNEDSYFTVLTQNLAKELKHCKMPFYLWRWRENSVCRSKDHRIKTYNYMIDANEYLVDDLLKHLLVDRAIYYVAWMVLSTYYSMNKPMWLDEKNKEYRDSTEKRFALYYRKMESLWNSVPMSDKVEISNQLRDKAIMEDMEMEVITLPAWIEHLKEIS